MTTPIIMPKFGQMTEESTIVEWFKKEGDKVAKGDMLFAVETDKSVMEVESFQEGTLLKIAVKPGVSVPVQSVVGFLGNPGETIPDITAPTPAPSIAKPSAPVPAVSIAIAPVVAAQTVVAQPFTEPRKAPVSPRARALARTSAIDPTSVKGTGEGGRVVERDVKAYLEAKGYYKLRITPAAKRLAANEEIDLLSIETSDGRIGLEEVQRAMAEKPVTMSRMRQVIAQRLAHSAATAPHFYVTVETDMGEVLAARARLKAEGASLSINDFIAHAAVATLKEFPKFNSSTDGRTIRWKSRVNLGLAVSLEEGLVVPVIRGADEMTLAELGAQAAALAAKARAGSLTPDEMSGSSFTISNMGMLDVENFTAIINPGEAAILAVSSVIEKPVALQGKVIVRPMMKMTLSSDHRLIDGAAAARFINALKKRLESAGTRNP
jgi:pyruvate dehydrogenase E2 component (dihydrolipoamide acetyltransferase)